MSLHSTCHSTSTHHVPSAPRKPRKKPKTTTPGPFSAAAPIIQGPIPQPYLALAPSSVTSFTASTPYTFPTPARSTLVLPSNYKRGKPSSASLTSSTPSNTGPSNLRNQYGAGLLAPPTIMPGGQSAQPRIQTVAAPPQTARRRTAERVGVGGRRSEDRLRDVAVANASMSSLDQVPQIQETERIQEETVEALAPAQTPAQQPQRRRRRIVRGEEGGLTRRLTVTTREEGRALGLARGASMRRLNVWDGMSMEPWARSLS